MKTPTEFELQHFVTEVYDPAKAHKYYEEHKKLKGRSKGSSITPTKSLHLPKWHDPRTGKTAQQIGKDAKTKQRKELAAHIGRLSKKLGQLEALIKKKEHEASSEDRKGKAKKERAAKEKDKPKSAAEKAKAAREGKKDRAKHKQGLKTKAKDGPSAKKKAAVKKDVTHLKALATKVKGQIAVAKQKLAAL